MIDLTEKAGKYSLATIIGIVMWAIFQLNIFELKSDLYRDFVTKSEYNRNVDDMRQKLDYIIGRIDYAFDHGKMTHR